MRFIRTFRNLVAICGLSLTITACGGGGGGGSSQPPATGSGPGGGGTDTPAKPSVNGIWVGSYTIPASLSKPTGVSSHGFGRSLPLAMILPCTMTCPSSIQTTTNERTVHFSVSYLQSPDGVLTGSYSDGSALGTINGALSGTNITMTVNFIVGATGKLDLSGNLTLQSGSSTVAATITGTVTENYTPNGGTPLAGTGPTTIGEHQQTGTAGTGEQPANTNDFTGWWQSEDSGYADRSHDGGGQFSITKNGTGNYVFSSVFGFNMNSDIISSDGSYSQGSGTISIVNHNSQGQWWKTDMSLDPQGVLMTMVAYFGGSASTPNWQSSPSEENFFHRLNGPICPTLDSSSTILVGDYDATQQALPADMKKVVATFDGTTVTFTLDLGANPDLAYQYRIMLLDQRDYTDGVPIIEACLGGGSNWSYRIEQRMPDVEGPGNPISSGVSLSIQGTSIVFSISKSVWTTIAGSTPTGGHIRCYVSDAQGDFWGTMHDLTSQGKGYFKLP